MPAPDSLMAFLCNPAGTVTQVLRDDFDLETRLQSGQTWTLLLDSASLDKSLLFFNQVNEKGFAAGWELNVRTLDEVTPLHFSGGRVDEHVMIVGANNLDAANHFYEEEILAINNEQANLIRSLIKEKSTLQRQKNSQDMMLKDADKLQEIILDDAAKLNNELVTLQRQLVKANHELEQKQHMLESIMRTMPDILYTIDLDNLKILFSNRKISNELGYPAGDNPDGETVFFESYLHPEDISHLPERIEKYKQAEDHTVLETEYRLRHVSDSWRWYRSRDIVFERDVDGNPSQILGIAQDITVYKLIQEKLWNLSTRDALTGLYNRTYFDGELERMSNGRQYPISIMVMDINNLKTVNDQFGHTAGDDLLRRAAEVFSKAFRGDDVVARIGGDEFAVLLPQTSVKTITHILNRLNDFIEEHNGVRWQEIELSIAIGHATAEHTDQLKDVFKLADEEMYMDKTKSKIEQDVKKKKFKEDMDARND